MARTTAIEVIRPPKTDEAKFIEQLEESWRRRYGDKVELDWIEAAGQRWRVCRRPGRGGDSLVYQMEKTLRENADKIPAADKDAVERAMNATCIIEATK